MRNSIHWLMLCSTFMFLSCLCIFVIRQMKTQTFLSWTSNFCEFVHKSTIPSKFCVSFIWLTHKFDPSVNNIFIHIVVFIRQYPETFSSFVALFLLMICPDMPQIQCVLQRKKIYFSLQDFLIDWDYCASQWSFSYNFPPQFPD
jgi:hypothetical protein